MNETPTIVVAVGPTDVDAAVAYAAEEAVRTGATLHLVHVVHLPAMGLATGDVYPLVRAEADDILAKAVERAHAFTEDRVPVTSELLDEGGTVTRLLRASDDASMLVLQHRDLGPVRRLFAGSTVNGVAARARVPVVSVPGTWRGRPEGPPDTRPVTVAVQNAIEAPRLLHAACDYAAARGAGVTVLHAWSMNTGLDVPVYQDYARQLSVAFASDVAPALKEVAEDYPDLAPEVEVVAAAPVDALLEASSRSQALVLGRRHHHLPLGSHLGPVARTVLNHSRCPVLVAAEPQDDTRPHQPYRPGPVY